jgi:SAM-dependent methyltransferase
MENYKSTKDLFNLWATNGRSDTMAAGHHFAVQKMLELIHPKQAYDFLDIGCGNGWVAREISKDSHCTSVVGIDLSDAMIALCQERKDSEKQKFICENITAWDTNQTFDIIFSMETFYYIHPVTDAINKIYKLLNTDGFCIIGIDFYTENVDTHKWAADLGVNMQLYTIAEWQAMFQNCGFKNIQIKKVVQANAEETWKREHGTLLIIAEK